MSITGFQRLLIVTCVLTYFLVVVGAIVRATGSGLGCPDWPLCHGRIIPPFEREVLIEYSHRLAASLVTVLVAASAVLAWTAFRRFRLVATLTSLAVVLLLLQIVLGGVTVLLELPETIVTLHLGVALLLLATLIVATAAAYVSPLVMSDRHRPPTALGGPALIAAAATYFLLLTGAFVRGSGASLGCPDWPLCYGQLVPAGDHFAAIHVFHRLTAAAVGAVLVWLLVRSHQTRPVDGTMRRLAGLALAIYAVQVLVGAANVWWRLPDALVAAHVALASALWACLVVMAAIARLARRPGSVWSERPRDAPRGQRSGTTGIKEGGAG